MIRPGRRRVERGARVGCGSAPGPPAEHRARCEAAATGVVLMKEPAHRLAGGIQPRQGSAGVRRGRAPSSSMRSPPNVKVMPQTTAKARYGGVSSVCAQLLFGGSRPTVPFPSRMVGLNVPGETAALYARTCRFESVSVEAGVIGQLAECYRLGSRSDGRAVVDLAEERRSLRVEDLEGGSFRLAENLGAVLGIRVVPEVRALVHEPLAADVDDQAEWVALARVSVRDQPVTERRRRCVPRDRMAARPVPIRLRPELDR